MKKRINNLNHEEKVDNKKLHILSILSFLMGFSMSLLAYITSSYLMEIMGSDDKIGLIYIGAYLIVLLILLNLHKIVRLFGKSFTLQLTLILKVVSVVGMLFFPTSDSGIWFLILYIISDSLAWASLDSITESFSEDRSSGRIRGLHLSIANLGFLMGPMLSAQLLENYGFSGVFLVSLIAYSLVLILAMIGIRKTNHRFKKRVNVAELLKKVFRRKDIMTIYYASFVLEFFFAIMIIYAPLYLLERGFGWDQLGVAFTIMLIPFVVVQYPIGFLADKKTGEREFLIFSFFALGVSTLAFYFSDSPDIMVWATILLLGRTGAALAEILRDSYFYKRIDGNDVDVIDFFRTARSTAYIAASGFSILIMAFFDLKSIFIMLALVCFSAIYPMLKLPDNKSEKDILKCVK